MSQITGVYKSSTKSIFKLSKDQSFYEQFSKVMKDMHFENVLNEDPVNKKVDVFEDMSEKDLDITLVYGRDLIFVIAFGKLDKFNDKMHKEFI